MAGDTGMLSQIVASLFSLCILVLRYFLIILEYCYINYPKSTSFLLRGLAVYAAYRIVASLARMLIRTIYVFIRTLVVIFAIMMCLAIFVRGSKFFSVDLVTLKGAIGQSLNIASGLRSTISYSSSLYDFANLFFTQSQGDHKKIVGSINDKILNDYGIEVDLSYLNYMKNNFDSYDKKGAYDYEKVNKNVYEHINDYLQHNDLEHTANKVLESLKNIIR